MLGLRAKPGGDDSLEPETEWYFTDTGESVPSAVPEAPEE